METVLILVIAAGLSAAVVWWASMPPGTPLLPRRRPAAGDSGFGLRDGLPVVEAQPLPAGAALPDDGFMIAPGAALDDRPPRFVSVIRIVFTIGFVAVLGVATLALLGFLVKLQLDKYLGGV